MGAGGLNSDPQACYASILTHEAISTAPGLYFQMSMSYLQWGQFCTDVMLCVWENVCTGIAWMCRYVDAEVTLDPSPFSGFFIGLSLAWNFTKKARLARQWVPWIHSLCFPAHHPRDKVQATLPGLLCEFWRQSSGLRLGWQTLYWPPEHTGIVLNTKRLQG